MTTSTFTIFNRGFGIWQNFDAVLRYSRATMCGIAVFLPPLCPPPIALFHFFVYCEISKSKIEKVSNVSCKPQINHLHN